MEASDLIIRARTGKGMEIFLSSDAGRYLWERIDEYEKDAECDFRAVNPHKPDEVMEVQNRLVVADMIREFIRDAIEEGNLAAGDLE